MKANKRNLKYRYAQVADAEALAEVYILAKENKRLSQYELDERQSIRASKIHDLQKKLAPDSGYQGLIVSLNDKMVGFTCYRHEPSNEVHIEDLHALYNVGSALHKKLVMIKDEAEAITLFATGSAQTAYERWGYGYEMPDGHMKLAGSALKKWRQSMAGRFPRYPILPPD